MSTRSHETNTVATHGREPASYWHEATTHVALSTRLPSLVDVVVIGGGLLGASACYWLAQAGSNVVLLERTMFAAGATGRNAGFISIGPTEAYPQAIEHVGYETAHAILRLTLESRSLLRQVLEEEAIACDYREASHLNLALTTEQCTAQAQSRVAFQADGVSSMLLDRQQVQETIDTPLGPDIIGGFLLPNMAFVHPARLVYGLVGAAQRHGAHMVMATARQVVADGTRIVVETTRGLIQTKAVIVATNAWISELLPQLAPVVIPVRGQMLAYAPLAPIFSTGLSVDMSGTEEYWQQTPDGTIVLGGGRAAAPGFDVGVRESQPTAVVQRTLEQVFPRLFPSLSGLRVVRRWAGLMAFTPDYVPIADRLPDMPTVWVVGGFSGHGMPFGLALGQALADGVLTNALPDKLVPFRLDRSTLTKEDHTQTPL